ncbi:class I SAM-dependent methyltransferase [Methanofollis formosanus]|uniref:Class I SAM-dependent methyltransferase n=1 Tax=Methanofollis formosanus TaxID=299308 RepID=A0A8G1EF94_9EURY|nr:class I SAM-dependent methyltransferase [Methanofollis formosanus]QYZ78555.1 class I SAM-dependent methyltransferase [Methanofollis formosanus]
MKGEEHFHEKADVYEDLIVRIVSDAPAFFGTIADFIPEGKIEVLELGSGTGFVTEQILSANPQAKVTCIDMDPAMLAVAQRKENLKTIAFLEGDFREVWPDGMFDLVLTSLCLHHLPDDDRAMILGHVHDALKPGGRFVNGDVFRPEEIWEEKILSARWYHSMQTNGLPAVEAESMLAKRERNYQFLDTFTHFREKMTRAGFERILCPYVDGIYAVFVGCR